METLKNQLENFSFEGENVDKLTEEFARLAPYFLYSGYISVLNKYRVYIQRVEFYFHSEKNNGIKDKIVYHRNNNHIDGDLPYFKPLTIHAHASGFDIAFENPKEEYRASALIRAYEIYDENEGKFLKYKSAYEEIKDAKTGKIVKVDRGQFKYTDQPSVNTQSTYLYDILNGFGDAGKIVWVDDLSSLFDKQAKPMKGDCRQGVYTGTKWQDSEYEEPRKRKWSFSRKTFIKQ